MSGCKPGLLESISVRWGCKPGLLASRRGWWASMLGMWVSTPD